VLVELEVEAPVAKGVESLSPEGMAPALLCLLLSIQGVLSIVKLLAHLWGREHRGLHMGHVNKCPLHLTQLIMIENGLQAVPYRGL